MTPSAMMMSGMRLMRKMTANAKVSDGNQPRLTFDWSLSESVGSCSVHRLGQSSFATSDSPPANAHSPFSHQISIPQSMPHAYRLEDQRESQTCREATHRISRAPILNKNRQQIADASEHPPHSVCSPVTEQAPSSKTRKCPSHATGRPTQLISSADCSDNQASQSMPQK